MDAVQEKAGQLVSRMKEHYARHGGVVKGVNNQGSFGRVKEVELKTNLFESEYWRNCQITQEGESGVLCLSIMQAPRRDDSSYAVGVFQGKQGEAHKLVQYLDVESLYSTQESMGRRKPDYKDGYGPFDGQTLGKLHRAFEDKWFQILGEMCEADDLDVGVLDRAGQWLDFAVANRDFQRLG